MTSAAKVFLGVYFVWLLRNGLKPTGGGVKKAAFTLVEIMVVVVIIGLLAAIGIPSFVKARNTSAQNICIANLRVIDNAKGQLAIAVHMSDGDTAATESVNEYTKTGTTPICPAGGVYTYENIGVTPLCSITTPTSHIFAEGGN